LGPPPPTRAGHPPAPQKAPRIEPKYFGEYLKSESWAFNFEAGHFR
jgi:hypothetical protein